MATVRRRQFNLQLGLSIAFVVVLAYFDDSNPVFWYSNLYLVLSVFFLNFARKQWKKDLFNSIFYLNALIIYTLHPTVLAVFMLLLLLLLSIISYRPKTIEPKIIGQHNYLLYFIPTLILLRTGLYLTSNEHSYLDVDDISRLGYTVIMLTPLQVVYSFSRSVNNFAYSFLRRKRLEGRTKMILSVMDMYSHSLRTPISTIYYKSMGQAMLAKKERREPDPMTEVVSKESQYLVELLDQLTKTFHDVLPDRKDEKPWPLEEVLKSYASGKVFVQPVPNVLLKSNERALLLMSLNSLVKNGLEYGASRVTLSCQVQPEHYRIDVTDNGQGMDEETLGLYGTAASSKDSRNATGLGVFFIKQILSIFNCQLTARSQLGKGTRVSLTIPR